MRFKATYFEYDTPPVDQFSVICVEVMEEAEWKKGDYSTLDEAKSVADSSTSYGDMVCYYAYVYDHEGKRVYTGQMKA